MINGHLNTWKVLSCLEHVPTTSRTRCPPFSFIMKQCKHVTGMNNLKENYWMSGFFLIVSDAMIQRPVASCFTSTGCRCLNTVPICVGRDSQTFISVFCYLCHRQKRTKCASSLHVIKLSSFGVQLEQAIRRYQGHLQSQQQSYCM